ncbi:MAG: helix-turn-helix transcriptional regulator [Alphaproteobacteria bacterium]|nr:helix-turn-helix transcriptional regulator [Alphaproteobacteria bacterium]
MVETSAAARALKALREEAGLSMRQTADALAVSLTSYQHYEDRYKRAFLPLELMLKVAPVLARRGIDPARVMALAGTTPQAAGLDRGPAAAVPALATRPARLDRDDRLPVYGSAQAGPDGQTIAFDPIEWIDRPEALREVRGAFAMYVMNDSMEPKYEQGDMLYVHPSRTPRRMSHVVIVKSDDTALVKRLVRADPEEIVVRQYNPPAEYAIARREVKAIYLVLGSMDGR